MVEHLAFAWDGKTVRIGLERQGSGPTLLLLPALSSISTRGEMRPLQERLSSSFATVAVDWPGFGDEPRPAVAWRPETYRAFLRHVLTQVVVAPFATVAAGHGAGYLLAQAAEAPGFGPTGAAQSLTPCGRVSYWLKGRYDIDVQKESKRTG